MISITRRSRINNSIIVYVGKYGARVLGRIARYCCHSWSPCYHLCRYSSENASCSVHIVVLPLEICSQQVKHETQYKNHCDC